MCLCVWSTPLLLIPHNRTHPLICLTKLTPSLPVCHSVAVAVDVQVVQVTCVSFSYWKWHTYLICYYQYKVALKKETKTFLCCVILKEVSVLFNDLLLVNSAIDWFIWNLISSTLNAVFGSNEIFIKFMYELEFQRVYHYLML